MPTSYAYQLTFTQDIDQKPELRRLQDRFFMTDSEADTFVIQVTRDGSPFAIPNSIVAHLLMADNTELVWPGSVEQQYEVHATLPAEAYAVPGQSRLTIQLVNGSEKIPLFCADIFISRNASADQVVPAGAVPDLARLLAVVERAEAAAEDAEAAAASAVRFDQDQSLLLTDAQKATARGNISAPSVADMDGLKSAMSEYLVEPGEYYKVNLISGIYQGSIASDGSINPDTTNRVVVEFPIKANKRYYFVIAEKDRYYIRTVESIVITDGGKFNPADIGRISVSFVNLAFDGICRISCRYDDDATITPDNLTDVYAFEVVAKENITDISDLSSGYYSFSSQQQVSSDIRVNYTFNANNEKAYSFTAPTGCVLREIVIFNDNDKTKYVSNIQGNTTLKRAVCFVPQYIENPAIQIILAKDNASDAISVSDCETINVTEVY